MKFTEKMRNVFYDITLLLVKVFYRSYFRVRIIGNENIPMEGGIVIISNHASWLDPPLIAISMSRRVHFLAKKELFRIPLFNRIIPNLGAIPIKRDGVDRNALSLCRKVVKNGGTLLIFPEGSRSRNGDLEKLKNGAALIIGLLKKVTVIPVWIEGTYASMPRGKAFPRPGKLVVRYGKALKLPEKGVEIEKRDYYKTLSNLFSESLLSLKNFGKA